MREQLRGGGGYISPRTATPCGESAIFSFATNPTFPPYVLLKTREYNLTDIPAPPPSRSATHLDPLLPLAPPPKIKMRNSLSHPSFPPFLRLNRGHWWRCAC